MLMSEDDVSQQFYRQIDAGLRIPQSDKWNRVRVLADDAVFPQYKEAIRFATLALSNVGLRNYGSCSIVLQTSMIENRSSLLDDNSLLWANRVAAKGDLFSLQYLPIGCRATWPNRGALATAKIAESDDIAKRLASEDPLIDQGDDNSSDDFLEVHIYGPLTLRAVARVVIPRTEHLDRDAPYMEMLKVLLADAGVNIEECA